MRRAAARMRSRVAGAISGWSFKALLTVATDTPHSFAKSFRDGIGWPPFRERILGIASCKVLNRFRKFNIAHSVPKIKRKSKSFSSAASLLAFRFNLTCKNCASRFTFVTFRLKRKNFRCSFVMVFGVRGCMYILLLKWVSGLSFRVSPVCAAQNAAENRRGCADYF